MEHSETSIDRQPLSVAIVGTGNVAQALGAALRSQGVQIAAVAGRDAAKTRTAAAFIGTPRAVTVQEIAPLASTLLLSVSDHAIGEVAAQIAKCNSLPDVVLHTCGSIGPEVLQPFQAAGCHTGVLHPLQTIPNPQRGAETIPAAYLAYCGDDVACARARELIAHLGGKALAVAAEHWALYHAAAVLSINYHVTLLDASLELWEQAGIGRAEALAALSPIVRAGTENLLESGPEHALTGPIRRGDIATVQRHLRAIGSAPDEIRNLYRAAAWRTLSLAKRAGLPEPAREQLAALLKEDERT